MNSLPSDNHPDFINFDDDKHSFITSALRQLNALFLNTLFKTYFRLKIEGREHLPKQGSYILASNHSSHMDSVILALASGAPLDQFCFLAAKDYYFDSNNCKIQFYKKMLNLVPFDRRVSLSALKKNIATCRYCVEHHKNLIVFPEGTRSLDGKIQPFKTGVAMLAAALRVPVIPAYIEGAYECMPKGQAWPSPGKVWVRLGPKIEFADEQKKITAQDYKRFTEELYVAVQNLKGEYK